MEENLCDKRHDISLGDDHEQKWINCSSILGRLVDRYIKTRHWVSVFDEGYKKVGLDTMETSRKFLRQAWSPQ